MNSYLWLIKEPIYIGSVVVNDSRRTSNRHNFAKKKKPFSTCSFYLIKHLTCNRCTLVRTRLNCQNCLCFRYSENPVNHTKSLRVVTVFANTPRLLFSFFLLLSLIFFFYKLQAQCSALTSFVCLSGIQLAPQLKPGLRKALRQYLSMCYQSNLLPLDDFSKQRHVFKYFPFQVNLEAHILLHH